MAYFQTLDDVKAQTVMPGPDVDRIEASDPGWILKRSFALQGVMDARLRKRCPVPFAAPVPAAALTWLGWLLTPELYTHGGIRATDEQQSRIDKTCDLAWEQIKEAANGAESLFDLPARADTTESAETEPATLFSTDSSVFDYLHRPPAGRGDVGGSGIIV